MLKDGMLYYQSPGTSTVLSGDKKIGVADLADLPTPRNMAGESLVSPCLPLQSSLNRPNSSTGENVQGWASGKLLCSHQGYFLVALSRAERRGVWLWSQWARQNPQPNEVLWYPCATANYAFEARRKQISGSVGEQDPSKLYLGAHKNNCVMTLVLVMRHRNVSSLEVNRFYHPQKKLIGIICARVVDTVIPNDLGVEGLAFGLTCWGNGLDWRGVAYFEIQGFLQRVLLDPVLCLSFFASYPRNKQVFSAMYSHSGVLPGVDLEEMKPINQGLALSNHEAGWVFSKLITSSICYGGVKPGNVIQQGKETGNNGAFYEQFMLLSMRTECPHGVGYRFGKVRDWSTVTHMAFGAGSDFLLWTKAGRCTREWGKGNFPLLLRWTLSSEQENVGTISFTSKSFFFTTGKNKNMKNW